MITIKRFNDRGIKKFEELLLEFRMCESIETTKLNELINNDQLTENVEIAIMIEIPHDRSKFAIAKYLSELLDIKNNRQFYRDEGLWTWISAYFLEILVPYKKKTRARDFKEKALYVLESSKWNRYYRHLLAFSTLTYTELQERGRIFLRGEIYERGEIVEQLAAVYRIQRNPSIIEAATILFYDPANDSIVKGAADKTKGGTARRFREVLKQFQMTFDLNAMNGAQIANILPFEFNRWKKAS